MRVTPRGRDSDAIVWHDQRAYHRFMAAHGWTLPPAERMGHTAHPGEPAQRRGGWLGSREQRQG